MLVYKTLTVILLITIWALEDVNGQFGDNAPPTVIVNRNWFVPDNTTVGSIITHVTASDEENDELVFGLELSQYFNSKKITELPFSINNATGVVYLNSSLIGKAGENVLLYVTVSDGHVTAKSEVYVKISDPNAVQNRHQLYPLQSPGLNSNPFSNFPSIPPQLRTRFTPPTKNRFQQKTYLQPTDQLQPEPPAVNNTKSLSGISNGTNTSTDTPENITVKKNDSNEILLDEAVKTVPDLATTLIPIILVSGIFLVVAFAAFVLRNKICPRRTKGSKADMEKESSGGTALQEMPSLAIEHWRGPSAFNNRYEPWDRESSHNQLSEQPSTTEKSNDRWEFPRHRLKVFNILGEGAFGQVWRCEALNIDGQEGVSVVAVKTLKENANEKEKSDLVSELQVMKMLEPHPNVVRLLGCCTDKDPVLVIMEYITKGKLQSYLRNSRAERCYNNMHGQSKTLTSSDLTSFVYQVAKGMEYLSTNGIIHRDLAARNILITEDHICKVADFGFARDVISSHIYERKSEGRLPIRWMAPESLYDNIFSVKSDVWSFGVFLWEVVTLGSTPYPGLSAADVMRKVRDGYRLEKPEHCKRELYNIMFYCWESDANQRPAFQECVELLEKLLVTETDYIELERFPDHSYYNMVSLSGEKL